MNYDKIIEEVEASQKKQTQEKSASQYQTKDVRENIGDDRQLPEILKHLSAKRAADYETWVRVGMALHNTSPDLLPLWKEWSRQSSKYDESQCEKSWGAFGKGEKEAKLAKGSLIYWAREDSGNPDLFKGTGPLEAPDDPHRLARAVLSALFNHPDGHTLCYWRQDWHKWAGRNFEMVPEHELKAMVSTVAKQELDAASIKARQEWRKAGKKGAAPVAKKVSTALVNNILLALSGVVVVSGGLEPPCFLEDECKRARNALSFENGIVNLGDLMAGKEAQRTHTPKFFCLGALPFKYEAGIACPRWLKFLDEMLPDKDIQALLQEWFGYSLCHDTTYHKFMMLVGDGANGKSVVLTVYRLLLGPENVSTVGLEGFNYERTFALAATFGKLANIIPELGEITKTNEGVLKAFVAGEPLTVERKHKDPTTITPTARLMIATNVLPRVCDRTDGLWRRMLMIPFKVQLLDEAKQDHRLVDAEAWKQSGELPGIFNWAIEGLKRLRQRGHFVEPKICKIEKEQYRKESNPAAMFLEDHCTPVLGNETPTKKLYDAYRDFATQGGWQPLSKSMFGREVKRVLHIEQSAHPKRISVGMDEDGKPIMVRDRVWSGLKMRE